MFYSGTKVSSDKDLCKECLVDCILILVVCMCVLVFYVSQSPCDSPLHTKLYNCFTTKGAYTLSIAVGQGVLFGKSSSHRFPTYTYTFTFSPAKGTCVFNRERKLLLGTWQWVVSRENKGFSCWNSACRSYSPMTSSVRVQLGGSIHVKRSRQNPKPCSHTFLLDEV